jgi:hypothetical protein
LARGDDASSRLDPADSGHVDVHQNEVGLELGSNGDCFFAGRRFGDDVESRRLVHHSPGGAPERRLIVDHEHFDLLPGHLSA